VQRLIVQGRLSRRAAEALMLEIRMLAASCGLDGARIDISTWGADTSAESPRTDGSPVRHVRNDPLDA
jgi:hypothetical protein